MSKRWKSEEEGLLLVLFDEGLTDLEIANVLNQKFGTVRSDKSIQVKLSNLRKEYNFPTRRQFDLSTKLEHKLKREEAILPQPMVENVSEDIVIEKVTKLDIPPTPKEVVSSKRVKKMRKQTKRSQMGYTVAEDIIILKHYGVVDDELIANQLDRTVSGIQYRYRKIKGSDYVAGLLAAGIQNPNLGQLTHLDEVEEIAPKKPSFLKRWKMRRLEKKALKAKARAANLRRKLKKMEE